MYIYFKKPKEPKKSIYDEQIEKIEADIRSSEYGSKEWADNLDNLANLQEQKAKYDKDEPKKIDGSKVLAWVTGIGGLVTSVAGIFMTWNTAKMAYANDDEMKMVNGRVWKLKDDYNKYKK